MTNIKVIEKEGSKPGKTIVVLAGIHGNEVCGVQAFNEIIQNINIEFGKVYFIYANNAAIRENKRYIQYNLNRCFLKEQPLDIKSSLEGKTAREIMPYLDEAEAVLDIHASFTKDSIPFVICDEQWIREADIFDAEIVSYNWDPFEPGSTDYYMNLQSKPGFCFECGYLADSEATNRAKEAINQFLVWNKCILQELKRKDKQKIIKITDLYKNKFASFKIEKYFPDFIKLTERTKVGNEGNDEIFREKNDILLFVRDCQSLNEECFLTAEESIIKLAREVIS